jgi:hypothetical protein
MEALSIIMSWCLVQFQISDTTHMYVEVIDLGCINFVNPKNCKSIVAKEINVEFMLVDVYWRGWRWMVPHDRRKKKRKRPKAKKLTLVHRASFPTVPLSYVH